MSRDIDYSRLPEHIRGGAQRYIEHGIPPGGFLTAVIRNDIADARGRADHINRACLHDIVGFFHDEAPPECWGSREKMETWITQRCTERAEATP